jgi:hypothetical protein
MVALPGGQFTAFQAKQLACMFTQNLHGAVGPAVALFFVIRERVRYQAVTITLVNVNRLMPLLKNPQLCKSVWPGFCRPARQGHG